MPAGQESDLLSLAKANVEKFASELPALPKSIAVRFEPAAAPLRLGRHDSERQALVL